MLDMCKYNMASQPNSTTKSMYSLGSEGPDITNMVSWPNIQSIQIKAQAEAQHVWVQTSTNEKKAEKPD